MAEPYLVRMGKEGRHNSGRLTGHTLEELFGKAVTIDSAAGRQKENERLIGDIYFTETVIEKEQKEENRYRVTGVLTLPEGWESYRTYVDGISGFYGNAFCTATAQGYRIEFEITAPLSVLGQNEMSLYLKGSWQGQGEETQSSDAFAELVCCVKLDALGKTNIRHRLFRGNAWEFYVDFFPQMYLSSVADFIGSLVGTPQIADTIVLPEGIRGLDFLTVSGLRFFLSPSRFLQGIEICLTAQANWKPAVPYFTAEEIGVSLYFSVPTGDAWTEKGVTYSCGVFGTFCIPIKSGFKLRFDMWCDVPGLTISGGLLAEQEKAQEDAALSDVLTTYGIPSADVGKLTVADLSYVVSVPGRAFLLQFVIGSGEILSFSILGLPIAITEISGEFSYEPDALALVLAGEMNIGGASPFTLGLKFDYDCAKESGWHFKAELIAGEVSIAALLSELFRMDALRDEPLFDLKLTDFAAEFYSNDRGPFTVRAALEQPWSTKLLGVNLVLFGSVDLTKAVTGEVTGTLMAGFKLNAFGVRVFYDLVQEADYRFWIWYENAYLEARYEKREEHELLVLGLKGMTLYGLVAGFVHMVNPNADFKLSAPWDILDRIRLDDFSLEFDMQERIVTMLYEAELDLLGVVEIRQIGIRYSRKETAKVEFILVGSVLGQEYAAGDPLTWDAVDDNPPDIGGTDGKIIQLDYLGMGQHFGTEELLAAQNITEAVEALKGAIRPIGAGEHPALTYAEGVNWLFGADMTYRGMLRLQLVLNDPSLYGILITVKKGDDNALSQLAGLSLELLYRKITDDFGMFSAELTVPDRFRVLNFGVLQITLGRFYLEVYTNGNFYLDLGFPRQQDFSSSFVVEAGYYTGRGGVYFGVLSQENCEKMPQIINGRFDPVIAIGVGLSLGIGRSFDFSVVKGAVSLEFFAIFEGLFAVYTPSDTSQKKDFYYAAKAVAGIYGRLFLSVDFVIISVSANAEVKAYASVALESYQPILFAVDLDLKVGASIKILFVKISFSFHFSMHMDFSIGEVKKTPWKLVDGTPGCIRGGRGIRSGRGIGYAGGYRPQIMHAFVGKGGAGELLTAKRGLPHDGERVEIALRVLPLYTVLQPSLEPCAAFLFLVGEGEEEQNGFAQIIKIAEEWIASHMNDTVSLGGLERLSALLREETGDFAVYFKERTRLVLVPAPADPVEETEKDGVFFPVVPGMVFRWQTYDPNGETVEDETVSFADAPMVDGAYMEMLKEYFARLNPAPEEASELSRRTGRKEAENFASGTRMDGADGGSAEESAALAEVLLEDYLAVILQAVTKEAQEHFRAVRVPTEGKTLRELADSFWEARVPFRKRHDETWESMADELGMSADALRAMNSLYREAAEPEDGMERMLSVGVTPHSILLDNPGWKFAAETVTVDGTEYTVGGMRAEQVLQQYRISLDALAKAVQDEREVFAADAVVVRNVPLFKREEVCGVLHSQETIRQAAGMVSRFFLQGLRLPKTSADNGRKCDASFLKSRKNWAGLYEILGQQRKLCYEETAEEDFLRHRLSVTAAAGYEDWIETGEAYAYTISNEEIKICAPSVLFTPVIKQPLHEIAPYVLEERQHSFEECRLYRTGEERQSILIFTADFMQTAYGHLSDYTWHVDSMLSGFGQTMGQNALGTERTGSFGLLLALTLRRTEAELPVYELYVTEQGSSRALDAVRKKTAVGISLLYEPSPVENEEEGLYRLPLKEESTRIVMTNLSRERENREGTFSGEEIVYAASMAEPSAFLTVLWQLAVTNSGGNYFCLEDNKALKPELFSSSGEGKLWLLVTMEDAEDGCNCIVDTKEISDSEYTWLAIKPEAAEKHPGEYAVKGVLNPGSAGFAASLAQPEQPEEKKEDAVRSLYSIINYRISGENYEECETGMPLLPKEPEDGAKVWEYSQSVPLDRFLKCGGENQYANAGMPAQIALEFRDVLGNAVENGDGQSRTDGECQADGQGGSSGTDAYQITITPRYNDALLAVHQSGAVGTSYTVQEGQLVLTIEPLLQASMDAEWRSEALSVLQISAQQIDTSGSTLYLESTLLEERMALPCGELLALYRQIQDWLLWTDSLSLVSCEAETLSDALTAYTLTQEELLNENQDVELSQIFGEQQLSVPVTKVFCSGATLAGLPLEEGWKQNENVLLHAGTDVIISGQEGRSYTLPAGGTFAAAAKAIGCHVSSLVEDNRTMRGILTGQYVFTFQGYEMEVGSEAGVTASLDDVCAAFLQYFGVDVTPMELAAEETAGILAEGAQISYRRLTALSGETLSANHFGCTAETLWINNKETTDLLENGTAVWCSTKTISAKNAGSLRELCEVYGITPEQFYNANCETKMAAPMELIIPSHIAFPATVYAASFTLPGNGGVGYSMAEICASYQCEAGLWFYRRMQDIIIEGTQFETKAGIVTASRFDTLESLGRKLTALGEDAETLLLKTHIVRDRITLPLLPAGKRFGAVIDTVWLRRREDFLLKLDAKLHLHRGSDGTKNPPEVIFHACTTVLPGNGGVEQTALETFAQTLEEALPFAYVLQGEAEQGTKDGLYLWIAKGTEGKGIANIKFHPVCCYDSVVKTPAIYALAPITTKLVNRESVPIAPLTADGSLGEPEPHSYVGVDAERFAAVFLQDMEDMFSPKMVETVLRHDCMEQMKRLLSEKELLAEAIPARLCHVLQPLGDVDGAVLPAARKAFSEKLRASLPRAYGKNVLLQYPGTVEMEEQADTCYRLAGSLAVQDFAEQVELKAGELALKADDSYLHLFAEAERLRNASFELKNAAYHIRELERPLPQAKGAYAQSDRFSFLRPLEAKTDGENIAVDLSCGLLVPVPLRFYPAQPALKKQGITAGRMGENRDIAALLHYDYHVTLSHEMAGQDMIYVTIVFNEKLKVCQRNADRDVFDCLAQYMAVREELLSLLYGNGEGFEKAYETFVDLAYEAAAHWNYFEENMVARELEEKSYACHFRVRTAENELQIELFTEEEQLPVIHYVLPDGDAQKMEAERIKEGALYRLSGVNAEDMIGDITLMLTLEELDIFTYQSVNTRSCVTRNEALSDAQHPVNERFLYRTDESSFVQPLNALVEREEEVSLVVPAEYKKECCFEERAIRYLFENVLNMGQQNPQLACQVSYGYRFGQTTNACVELPICFQPRTGYSDGWCSGLTERLVRWERQHNPPARGRYLRIEVTVFSTELQEEGIPVVRLGGIRVSEL